jgi:hypothetical protein
MSDTEKRVELRTSHSGRLGLPGVGEVLSVGRAAAREVEPDRTNIVPI